MPKIKWYLKNLTLSLAPILTSTSLVACGNLEDSNEKIKQDNLLASDDTKNAAKELNNEFIIANVYNLASHQIDDSSLNDPNSQFYKDAYGAYQFYIEANTLSNLNFFVTQRTTWVAQGYDHYILDNKTELTLDSSPKSENNFKVLFLNPRSPVRKEIVELLLVQNYLLNQNVENVKLATNYESIVAPGAAVNDTKTIFQAINLNEGYENDFFLYRYLLNGNHKLVWEWKIDGSLTTEQAIGGQKLEVRDVSSFNQLSSSKSDTLRKVNNTLNVNLNLGLPESEAGNLIAFNGIKVTSLDGDDLQYNVKDLKLNTDYLHGFFDIEEKRLFSIKTLKENATNSSPKTSVIVVSSNKDGILSLNANYLMKISPKFIKASETEIEAAKGKDSTTTFSGYFSFDGAPWNDAKKKQILAFWLTQNDRNTLLSDALNYFRAIGFSASSDRDEINGVFS